METVISIVRLLHSWTRWAFLVVAVIAIIMFVMGFFQKRPWTETAHRILNGYGSLLGLQWLFGLILVIALGSQTGFGVRHYWEHLTVQTIAMVVANAHHAWRRREMPDSTRWRNGMLVILASLAFVFIGILSLPAVIQWRFYVP